MKIGVGCSRRNCRATAYADEIVLLESKWTTTQADHGRDWWCPKHAIEEEVCGDLRTARRG